jgi:hypothetical protein
MIAMNDKEGNEKEQTTLMTDVKVDSKALKNICKRPVDWFWRKYKDHVVDVNGRKYAYIDNGSNILAVAHLDTVIDVRTKFNFNEYSRNKLKIIKCPSLDDRLGVYIILDMLPGILGEGWADILLTTDEEKGKSTASLFMDKYKDEKEYNWIVEFDRKGGRISKDDDAVLYSYFYDATDFKKALNDAGFEKLGRGSFTDISLMQDLGVKAFNVAVGYFANHSTKAFMYPIQTEYSVANFLSFYRANYDVKFEHKRWVTQTYKAPHHDGNYGYGGSYGYGGTQSYLPYSRATPNNTGIQAVGSMFKPADVVYNRRYTSKTKAIYIIDNVYEYEGGEFKYDLKSVDGVYSIMRLEEEHVERAYDICTYCFRKGHTWTYYDDLGMFLLCDTCREFIYDGEAMCEECLDLFIPTEENIGPTWGALCDTCNNEVVIRPGDVVVFSLADEEEVKGVPFYVTGSIGSNGCVKLWDGENAYENHGIGYSTTMLTTIRNGLTPQEFVDEFEGQTWAYKV